jgi:hypothetical protein
MKTKLTFLLSLTILFLFSGNSFGGVFDKEDEIASLWCQKKQIYLVINIKEKTIKRFSFSFSYGKTSRNLIDTMQIKKVTDLYIYGENKTKTSNWSIDRHTYYIPPGGNRVAFVTEHWMDKNNGEVTYEDTQCFVGERIF